MPSSLAMKSFSDELCKIAARRGVKMIGDIWGKAQKAFAAGDTQAGTALMERANKLAKTPGVVKPSAAGSQIHSIGRGSEGAVTAVADPEFGLAARKLYDPHGISTPELIKRKDVAGKALGKNEDVAEYFGQRATPQGGGTMQFSEIVPQARTSAPLAKGQAGPIAPDAVEMARRSPDYQAAKDNAAAAYKKHTPYAEPQDVRAANMIRDARTGKLRTVDAIPAEQGEYLSQADRAKYTKKFNIQENELLPITQSGEALTKNPGYSVSTDQLHKGMLGRGSPRPVAGTAPSQVGTVRNPVQQAGTAPARPSAIISAAQGTPQVTAKARPSAIKPSVGNKTVPSRPKAMGPAQAMAPRTAMGFR